MWLKRYDNAIFILHRGGKLMSKNEKIDVWDPEVKPEENRHNSDEIEYFPPVKKRGISPSFPVIDLFSGAGGFSTGLKMAGFDIVLGLDIHEPSIETFRYNHEYSHAILGDIRETGKKFLSDKIKKASKNQKIEMITAGIPCPGFSRANRKQNDEDERNYLFKYFLEVVDLVKPKFILVENVSNMENVKNGDFVQAIKGALQGENGYKLQRAKYKVETEVLNAQNYGVPQKRKRLFFFGVREDVKTPIMWPNEIDGDLVTVEEAIMDLPPLKARESSNTYDQNRQFSEYQKKMRKNVEDASLTNHQAPYHKKQTIDRISNTSPGEPMYEKFRQRIRLKADEPSPTIISGGIRPQFQYGHPKQNRGLTVRERARLQSFPDDFEFKGGMVQGRVLTGQAVPPLLAKTIGENVFKCKAIGEFRNSLIKWFKNNGRRFPWRREERTPYEVLCAEILLRKTRAENVKSVYNDFIDEFPDLESLASSNEKELKSIITPLGFQNRKTNTLKQVGKHLYEQYRKIPNDSSKLSKIKGIGRYTINALLCFGFGEKKPIVDVNVERVYNYFFGVTSSKQLHTDDDFWEFSQEVLLEDKAEIFNYALLDYGSKVCTPKVIKNQKVKIELGDWKSSYLKIKEHFSDKG